MCVGRNHVHADILGPNRTCDRARGGGEAQFLAQLERTAIISVSTASRHGAIAGQGTSSARANMAK
jgi:hypothetical protein